MNAVKYRNLKSLGMKKSGIYLLLMLSFLVLSCTTPAEKSIKELEDIVMRVKTDDRFYTVEDYEVLVAELDALSNKYADIEYTLEQQQQIERLNTELSVVVSERFMTQMGGVFGGFMKGFVNAFTGTLIDGMNEIVNGMGEVVDGLQELVDDMNNM